MSYNIVKHRELHLEHFRFCTFCRTIPIVVRFISIISTSLEYVDLRLALNLHVSQLLTATLRTTMLLQTTISF